MSFTVQTMLGKTALVSGTDVAGNTGQTLVSTVQWDELNARTNFSKATEDFDAAVEEFFKPLVEAGEKLKEISAGKMQDSTEYIVLSEATEGVAPKAAQIVQLSKDSIILRLIEEGNTDRLVWVDESTLGVLAA
jgi:predicted nucleic acid-binding protein